MEANGGVNGVNGTSMGRQWTPMGRQWNANGRQWDANGASMDAKGGKKMTRNVTIRRHLAIPLLRILVLLRGGIPPHPASDLVLLRGGNPPQPFQRCCCYVRGGNPPFAAGCESPHVFANVQKATPVHGRGIGRGVDTEDRYR